MTEDAPKLTDLAGIFAGDGNGPHPSCRLCRDLIGWSAERAEGDICRDCAATIADPQTLRTLACWLSNLKQAKAVVGRFREQRYTLGMIVRKMADAIDSELVDHGRRGRYGARSEPPEPVSEQHERETEWIMTTTERENLSDLLSLVDQLFGHCGDESRCRYRLGRTRTGWQFDMADYADRWASLGLKCHFTGDTPQDAIRAFLDYIQQHGINVAELAAAGQAAETD